MSSINEEVRAIVHLAYVPGSESNAARLGGAGRVLLASSIAVYGARCASWWTPCGG